MEAMCRKFNRPHRSDERFNSNQKFNPFICAFNQKFNTTCSYRLIWTGANSGSYSAKLGYHHLKSLEPIPQHSLTEVAIDWKKLWSHKNIIPRVKVFIWRLLNNGLITASRLHHIFPSTPSTCLVCGQQEESGWHIMFNCTIARYTWYSSILTLRTDFIPDQLRQAFNFITANINDNLYAYCCYLLWFLWKARNSFIFQGKQCSPHNIITQATEMSNYKSLFQRGNMKRACRQIHIPSPAEVSLVDASWDTSNSAGLAGFTYNTNGHAIHCLSEKITVDSPLTAEIKAINMMIHQKLSDPERRQTLCHIFTDCKTIIDKLKDPTKDLPCWRSEEVFVELVQLTQQAGHSIEIRYAPREYLKDPHELANWCRRTTQQTIPGAPRPDFSGMLDDAIFIRA